MQQTRSSVFLEHITYRSTPLCFDPACCTKSVKLAEFHTRHSWKHRARLTLASRVATQDGATYGRDPEALRCNLNRKLLSEANLQVLAWHHAQPAKQHAPCFCLPETQYQYHEALIPTLQASGEDAAEQERVPAGATDGGGGGGGGGLSHCPFTSSKVQ